MQNPYLVMLRTAWQYARNERGRYVFIYGLFVLANIANALNPLLFGWFIDSLQRQGTDVLHTTALYVIGVLGLRLLEWAFHGPARVLERQLAFNVSRNFLNELYHQTLHLPIIWHKDHHSGATINRIRKAYEALKSFYQSGFIYLHTIFKCLFSFAAMLYFSPLFGGIGVLLGVLTVWVILKFDQPFIKSIEETNEREHEMSSGLFDSLSNIITVITLRLEKRMEVSLAGKIMAVFPPFQRQVRINEWKWFVASMLVATIYVVIAGGYVYQNWVPGTVFYVGGLVTLIGYVNQFTSVFSDVALQYTQIVQHNTDVQTARGIGQAYAENRRNEDQPSLPPNWQTIDIEGLNFSHQTVNPTQASKIPTLHNLQVQIRRGQRIAFIGESGSGKSTLLTILRGLNTPEPGVQFRVDGKDHPAFGAIADRVTLFPQEPEIFENTIGYNITLGLPFEESDIIDVCQTAHFSDIVRHLPQGLETSIQEKGVNLSGGQKQRLALARGVLAARSSDIVLLDEPTSSVDPKTEFMIYHNLLQEFSGKAVISTLHRLHLLPMFDYIYVMRAGQVVDEGLFTDLRQRSTIFQEMWQHQQDKLYTETKEVDDKI